MPLQHLFDLAGVDVLAAAIEHVVGSTHEKVKSIRVAAHHIAGQVPAVAHPGRGRLRLIQITMGQRRGAQRKDAIVGGRAVDEFASDVGQRVAERQRRPRPAIRVRPEDGRSGLRCAVAVLDLRVREHLMDLGKQRIRQWRRTDRHVAHAAQIEPLDEIALAHHQRIHRRDPGKKTAAVSSHGFQEASRVEARQQDHLHAIRKRDGNIEQSIHVIQRRHDDRRILRQGGRHGFGVAHGGPELAAVRERHALRHARGAGRVQNLRQRIVIGYEGLQRS